MNNSNLSSNTIKYNVIIYEQNHQDIQKLSFLCQQLGMNSFIAETSNSFHQLIKDHYFELAIINFDLEKITLPDGIKIITTGLTSESALFNNEFYQPKSFIPKPLINEIIKFNLIKVSGLIVESSTFPSNSIKLLTMLKNLKFQLNSLLNNKFLHQKFDQLTTEYCINECIFGLSPNKIEGETKEYKTIAFSSDRGPVLCKFVDNCMFHRLNKHFKEINPNLSNLIACDYLDKFNLNNQSYPVVKTFRIISDAYNNLIQNYIKNKEIFCAENCTSLDETSTDYGKKIKTLCCEYGCVLDNYFDLTPLLISNKKREALLYMVQGHDLKIIEHYCQQLNIKTFISENALEAQDIIKNNNLDVVILNAELDKINIPSAINTVVIGKQTISSTASILAYLPISFIPLPLEMAHVSLGILKAIGIFFQSKTLFAYLTNITIVLETNFMHLNNFIINDLFKMSLLKSFSYFCEHDCEFSTIKDDIPEGKLQDYEVINLISKKGPIYCNRKKNCPLWKYKDWLSSIDSSYVDLNLSIYLQNISCSGQNFSIIEKIDDITNEVKKDIDALHQTKIKYCTEICPEGRHDLNFSKKDNIFSDFSKVIKTNQCAYCQYHKCPQNNFFQFYKTIII